MTTPGSNFNVKPYIDDGSALPSVGAQVAALDTNGGVIEGQVTATSPTLRTITFNGFVAQVLPVSPPSSSPSWTYTSLSGMTAPWQSYATTTSVSSNYWFSRVGT